MIIHALHGFLGTPKDWELIHFPGHQIISWDLAATGLAHPSEGLWQWARSFNRIIESHDKARRERSILMGYSLGGRLALHAAIDAPHLWKGAIILSAHPGLKSEEVKRERIASDLAWAGRFASEPWDHLMQSWNGRDVFTSGSFNFTRLEKDHDRHMLTGILRDWSLGKQDDLSEKLASLDLPILWMCGQNDTKFSVLTKSIHLAHRDSLIIEVPNAGHRFPWESPDFLVKQVDNFLKSIRMENSYDGNRSGNVASDKAICRY